MTTKVPVELFSAGAGFTIGDGTAEDTKIVFDGNAQDYYIGLDDSADKLIIGVGSTVGTTPTITIDESQNFEISGTMNLLGFTGSKSNFTNSMLISNDAGTGTLSTANNNTGFGHQVFNVLTSGDGNTGMGADALSNLTTASDNTAIGLDAGKAIQDGVENTAVGSTALDSCTSGTRNTALGYIALSTITTAVDNTAVGREALRDTTASNNTAVGKEALKLCTTGSSNTAVGLHAGATIQSGSNNIVIGNSADVAHDTSFGIVIGIGFSGADNQFKFGKSSNVVSNTFTSDANWSRSSDERIKQDINDDSLGLNFINNLRTVTYRWKPSYEIPKQFDDYNEENQKDTEVVMHGMLAQEVKQALDKEGVNTFSGWSENDDGMQNISREMFVIPLIKAVQQLTEKCDSLQNEINELKGN
jgi:hypothetical protein